MPGKEKWIRLRGRFHGECTTTSQNKEEGDELETNLIGLVQNLEKNFPEVRIHAWEDSKQIFQDQLKRARNNINSGDISV